MLTVRPRIFVDASAHIALARRDDVHHWDAVAVLKALQRQRARLYTANFVVAEGMVQFWAEIG